MMSEINSISDTVSSDRGESDVVIGSIRHRLQDIRRRESEKFQTQIIQELSSCCKHLEALGAGRQTMDQHVK
jgi:hypothetical protein